MAEGTELKDIDLNWFIGQYDILKTQQFGYLVAAAAQMAEDGVRSHTDDDGSLALTFCEVTLKFIFTMFMNDLQVLKAKVIVVRTAPSALGNADVIGEFSFDQQGQLSNYYFSAPIRREVLLPQSADRVIRHFIAMSFQKTVW